MHSKVRLSASLVTFFVVHTALADDDAPGSPVPSSTAPTPDIAPSSSAPPATTESKPGTPAARSGPGTQPLEEVAHPYPHGLAPAVSPHLHGEPVPVQFVTTSPVRPWVCTRPDWSLDVLVAPIAECQLPCTAQLPRGRYRVHITKTQTTLDGRRRISIFGPSRVTISPHSPPERTWAFVVAMGGAAATIAGIALLVHWSVYGDRICRGNDCHMVANIESELGGLLIGSGAVLTGIGWGYYGFTYRPAIRVEPVPAPPRPSARVGFVRLRGGAGIGGVVSF